jgi:hypothetical protein
MDKLKIFSKKLNKHIEYLVDGNRLILANDGIEDNTRFMGWSDGSSSSWQKGGWGNGSSNWLKGGWANGSSNWLKGGWGNGSSNWQKGGWSNGSSNWTKGGWSNGGSSSCFITSAYVDYYGFSDNCYELETLRFFRDDICKTDDNFRELVLEYYKQAPKIVKSINEDEDKDAIYEMISNDLVKKCVKLIEENNKKEAIEAYSSVVKQLIKRYRIDN